MLIFNIHVLSQLWMYLILGKHQLLEQQYRLIRWFLKQLTPLSSNKVKINKRTILSKKSNIWLSVSKINLVLF